VASIHLHPIQAGTPLQSVQVVQAVENKGIEGEPRYFGRINGDSGQPSRRQVTLMEREQIDEHALALGMASIAPGAVRSNIETRGINLIAAIGKEIEIGGAVLFLYARRDPCEKMDAICRGLRERMMNSRQGVLAEVRRSGKIQVGDSICVRP
jgi:MOSC domain-containing protein YiiM